MNTIRSGTLKEGDHFFLRTLGEWQQGDCTLAANTTLTGQVAGLTVSTTGARRVVLALRFAPIPCAGSRQHLLRPVLIALQAIEEQQHETLKHIGDAGVEREALQGVYGATDAGGTRASNVSTSFNGLFGSAGLATVVSQLGQPTEAAKAKPLKTGEVRGVRGLRLELPQRDPSTALVSSHSIVLDSAVQFVIAYVAVPERPSMRPEEADAASRSRDKPGTVDPHHPLPPSRAPEPAPIEDVCVPPACKQLATIPNSSSTQAAWVLPLAGTGYQPRPDQETTGLEKTASVHFLGEDQILLTFTLHTLMPRSTEKDAWASNPRNVRAVLISQKDGRILRIKDWIVSDNLGPFVWAPGDGRVLAHIGHELVALGPDLTPLQHLALSGALLFVSAAPGGDPLLVATVHEKHTEQEHAEMSRFLGPGVPVDEEYQLSGISAAFQPIGTKLLSVEPIRPALLPHSMVTIRPGHARQWNIEEETWEGQSRPIARMQSACEVDVKSLPGNLLLAQGCVPTNAALTWYRVLNLHGSTLLKGTSSYGDFAQQAETSEDGKLFAIASSHFDKPVMRTSQLRSRDFSNLTLTVFNIATGRQTFMARLQQGSAQGETFAFSPSGSSLAVLTSDTLQVFRLVSIADGK